MIKNDLYGGEYDSEDDEGFFLTPVLHYDITNKIKEANKKLFEEKDEITISNDNQASSTTTKRSVTFAKELVTFAPQIILDVNTVTTTASDDDDEISISEELTPTNDIEADSTVVAGITTLAEDDRVESVENLTELNELLHKIDTKMSLEQTKETEQKHAQFLEDKKKTILVLDPPYPTNYKQSNKDMLEKNNAPFVKLINVNEEQVKSPTPTPSDDYEEDTFSLQAGIIARSQIRHELKEKKTKTVNLLPPVKKSTNSGHLVNNRKTNRMQLEKQNNPKFNYKICCEYQQARLPQYRGHISEYGLSLRERERLLQMHKRQERTLMEHETRVQAETIRRLTANEQAFSAWLLNKCRNAPNRTRNMFDVMKPRNCKRKVNAKF